MCCGRSQFIGENDVDSLRGAGRRFLSKELRRCEVERMKSSLLLDRESEKIEPASGAIQEI